MTDRLRKHRANCGGLCCGVKGIAQAADLWGFDCQTPLAEGSWLCYLRRGAHHLLCMLACNLAGLSSSVRTGWSG